MYLLARTRLVLTSSVRPTLDKNSADKNSSNKGTEINKKNIKFNQPLETKLF